jgi:thiamine-monophosphate kinase
MTAGHRVGDLGEFELIDRLASRLESGPGVVVGIGDDTAVLQPTPGMQLLATTDGQVEGSHFLRAGTPPDAVGHRLLASNLSDVAAMGGRPRWALVALTLPPDLPLAWVDGLYEGMVTLGQRFGVTIVGGNVARSPAGTVVDLTVLGEVEPDHRLTRAGARPGDAVFVTGWPGASAGGLELILHPELRAGLSEHTVRELIETHWRPTPRVEAGRVLACRGVATACIDISDGLAADLGHILAASGAGATLDTEALPVSPALSASHLDVERLVLHGGEAYELLFTSPSTPPDLGIPCRRIGTIEAEPGLRLRRPDGRVEPLAATGHDHFRSQGKGA